MENTIKLYISFVTKWIALKIKLSMDQIKKINMYSPKGYKN